jgi:hypothetical protein
MFTDPSLFATSLFLLIVGHCLADFPWQNDFLAKAKDPRNNPHDIWFCCMFAHCMIHAGAVFFLTESLLLSLVMFVTHFLIDMAKCSGRLGQGPVAFKRDQLLHLLVIVGIAIAYCSF